MKRLIVGMMAMALMMSGCAGGDYQDYATTLQTHSTAESTRISAQSQAISNMVATAKPATQMEGTLLAVIGMMQVERLQFVPLPIQKPTTGMDVLNNVTGQLPMAFMGLTSWGIAREGFKMAGDSNTFNGDATIDGSFNKSYRTDVQTGDSTSSTSLSASGETANNTNTNPAPVVIQ